jgi:hypothetical protein
MKNIEGIIFYIFVLIAIEYKLARPLAGQPNLGQQEMDLNKPVPEDNQYTLLEKEMNAYVLTSLKYERDSFTESDWRMIHEVANRCPQDWGDGVLKARGLWLKYGGSFELNWQDCFQIAEEGENASNRQMQSSREVLKVTQVPVGIVIYPVPATDAFNLHIPTEYVGGKYEITNLTGVVLESGMLDAEIKHFNTANLNNGLHFIQVRVPNKQPVVIKFVVQKF